MKLYLTDHINVYRIALGKGLGIVAIRVLLSDSITPIIELNESGCKVGKDAQKVFNVRLRKL